MALFRYEVIDSAGKKMMGAIEAGSEAEVRRALIAKGFNVLAVAGPPPSRASGLINRTQSMTPATQSTGFGVKRTTASKKELALFFRQLAQQMHAGIVMQKALTDLANTTPNRAMKSIIQSLVSHVAEGRTLNAGMAEFPRAFPPHITATVEAGEVGGLLPLMLGDIALDYELSLKASNRILKGISLTLWVTAIGSLLLAPALPLMVRGFFSALETSQGTSPGSSLLTMMGPFLSLLFKVLIPITAAVLLAYHGTAWYLKLPEQRKRYHTLVLKVPNFGQASRDRSVASFTRILWSLQNAGVYPIKAWEVASKVPENSVIAESLQAQTASIARGGRYSDALSQAGVLSADDIRLLANGESTGQVIDSLQRIAAYYQDAAIVSATKAAQYGLRLAIIAAIIGTGVATIGSVGYFGELFNGVDKYFGT
jgi:general secretion pathway protein F